MGYVLDYKVSPACSCMKHYCYNCMDDENGVNHLEHCDFCEKDHCRECVSIEECATVCHNYYCKECKVIEECSECQVQYCVECEPLQKCGGSCNNKLCESCARGGKCEKCSTFFVTPVHNTGDVAIAAGARTVVTAAMEQHLVLTRRELI